MYSCTDDEPALLTLRFAIALTCIASAARLLLYGGPVLAMLWMGLGWSETAAVRVEYGAAFGLLACVPFLFWRHAWQAAALVAGWLILSMIASAYVGVWHPELELGAQSARYLAPLALIALVLQKRARAELLLRIGAGATFISHGVESLLMHAQFIDYLIGCAHNLASVDLSESSARTMLLSIGILDLLVGTAILLPKRWRPLALWMACWGLLTACARIVYLGWPNWPEALIRVTNGAVPLTLFFLWSRRANDAETE